MDTIKRVMYYAIRLSKHQTLEWKRIGFTEVIYSPLWEILHRKMNKPKEYVWKYEKKKSASSIMLHSFFSRLTLFISIWYLSSNYYNSPMRRKRITGSRKMSRSKSTFKADRHHFITPASTSRLFKRPLLKASTVSSAPPIHWPPMKTRGTVLTPLMHWSASWNIALWMHTTTNSPFHRP